MGSDVSSRAHGMSFPASQAPRVYTLEGLLTVTCLVGPYIWTGRYIIVGEMGCVRSFPREASYTPFEFG